MIMVTNLVEEDKIKCEQYWPSQGLQSYGDINVMLEEEIHDPHIVIRRLKISKAGEQRRVTQYHNTTWPENQTPSVTSVLKLRAYLVEEKLKQRSPVLVHCSAGTGRTGTLIALDILMDQMDTDDAVDVKACVANLRHQRTEMVESLVYYKFLYECLNEVSSLGPTFVPVHKVNAFLKSRKFLKRTQQEYEYLEKVKPVFTHEETEYCRIDDNKNRDSQVMPLMDHRVKLSSFPDTYINAVYVTGYEGPNQFCEIQWPLKSTAGDFWRVILQEQSAALVCMENIMDDKKWFLGKNLSVTYDDITVSATPISEDSETQIYNISIKHHKAQDLQEKDAEYTNVQHVKKSDCHQLQMIVLKSWTSITVDKRNTKLVPEIYQKIQAQHVAENKAVTVTCRNGANETGLYIGASILFDMINKEQQVDVVQVVKQIRKTRPEFITSQDQYRWLYSACAAY